MYEFKMPAEKYLERPGSESCYQYLKKCYEKISKDIGDDYTAFVTPVGPVESEITMKRLFHDIEKMASFIDSLGIKKGDVVTAFLPTCGHAVVALYALNTLSPIIAGKFQVSTTIL